MTYDRGHLTLLDGWRALSIVLVLAAHMLPLGPKWLQLNDALAPMGMALFFTLSGFLITRMLLTVTVRDFLIRRFFRIIPLAWLAILIVLPFENASLQTYLAHLLFYGNIPPFWLLAPTAHLWSLCVEMQFYVGVAMIVAALGRRGLYLIPALCGTITLLRVVEGAHISIVTWLRADEILAGGIVALAFTGHLGDWPVRLARRLNTYWMIPIVLLTCHPASGPLQYLRPYAASAIVFVSLVHVPPLMKTISEQPITKWLAAISYALYVVHGVLMNTWLGEGDRTIKYLKRPLLIGLTFLLAHLSTYRWERPWIRFAKQITATRQPKGDKAISPGEA